jgi:shikimate kinase
MTIIPHHRRERIYLTGFMGSGKSTIGPILANTIGYDFVDLDRAIEEAEGKSVTRVFQEDGEQHFRGVEQSILEHLATRPQMVVALGGGTLGNPSNVATIASSGILVYIKISTDLLFKRLQRRSDRPLLMGKDGSRLSGAELRERIEQLSRAREPLYSRADITIDADERRVGITVDRVVRVLSPYLRGGGPGG